LQVAELAEGSGGGALVGVEAALETLEAVFEIIEGMVEGMFAVENVPFVVGTEAPYFVVLEHLLPESGFDGAEAADVPLVVDQSVHEVALARGDGVELIVVLGGELREDFGVFAADDVGLRVNAGFQGVHARDGFAGLGAGAGGVLRIQAIREDLLFGCHKCEKRRSRKSYSGPAPLRV
jgi:hypothetical protein